MCHLQLKANRKYGGSFIGKEGQESECTERWTKGYRQDKIIPTRANMDAPTNLSFQFRKGEVYFRNVEEDGEESLRCVSGNAGEDRGGVLL